MPPPTDTALPRSGAAETLAPGLVRLTAPNPSPFTATGTNSYLLGDTRLVVVDPGPDDPRHLAALLALIAGRRVEAVIVTHAHADHSALAPALARATGAPVAAFGDARAGRSPLMTRLAAGGLAAFGEGADDGFRPDLTLADGAMVAAEGGALSVLHTPGHFGNHICLGWNGLLFSGDHVMGWSTSIVSPPEGDMADYMASLGRLAGGGWSLALPGHGAAVADPAARVADLVAHRRAREAAVMDAVAAGAADLATITARAYAGTPAALLPAAERSCLAHLLDLEARRLILGEPGPRYRPA